MNFPYAAPFREETLINWMASDLPAEVGMRNSPYSWYAALKRECKRDGAGVPIAFLDAPKASAT